MSSSGSLFAVRRFALVGAAVLLLGAAAVQAQSGTLSNSSHDVAVSSSDTDSGSYSSSMDAALPDLGAAEPAAPAASAAGGRGQYDNRGQRHGLRWAFETGGGFNAPIPKDVPNVSWGGNLTIGGGLHLSHDFTLLGEYQFIANKLPGALVNAGGGDTGNAHINSITLSPVIDLLPNHATSVYLTGGGGWYHKSTNWNVLIGYDFYGYPVYATARSFSSNQWGANGGLGISHRLGGVYGDGTMKLFAEARYLWINTPPLGEPNGLGPTEVVPVTFGVRW